MRLIDENEEMVGVVETDVALRRARDAGLDLVEIAASSSPPVVRIMDFGKYKYEQSKKDKANRAKSKGSELKEVRLGRSMKIDPHDIQIRLNQAKRFLLEGHKVQIVQNFRGREMVHRERGFKRMKEIIEQLESVGKLEVPPRLAGRRMTMIVAPDRGKIEHYKARAAAAAEPDAADAAVESAPPAEPTDDQVVANATVEQQVDEPAAPPAAAATPQPETAATPQPETEPALENS